MNTTTDTLIAGIRKWVEMESPSQRPDTISALAELVAADARAQGLQTSLLKAGEHESPALRISNRRDGDTRKGIVVIGHLDTVHPVGTLQKNPFRIEEGRIYGPGIYDMKAGNYLAMSALAHEPDTALPVDILLTPDEEISSPHSRGLIEAFCKEHAACVLVAEPARPNGGNMVSERKGIGRIRLSTHGRQSHAGLQHALGRSAIREMAHQVLALESLTDYERGITVSVGTIHGGTTPNVVPGLCEAEADFRVPDMQALQTLQQHINALQPKDQDVELKVELTLRRPPMNKTPKSQALLDTLLQLSAQAGLSIGEAPMTGGASDANFTAALGIPSIDGLGADGDGAHTLHEHILQDTLLARHQFWRLILRTLS